MGASPALVPKPSSSSATAMRATPGSRSAAWAASTSSSSDSTPAWAAAKCSSTTPSRARAIPAEQTTTYFQAASTAARVRRCPTRNAVTIVVASTATHSTPRFAASTASAMAAMNPCVSTPYRRAARASSSAAR